MIERAILFTGWYGHQNTGDDAFIEVADWGARKYWDRSNNLFLGRKDGLPIISESIKGYPVSVRGLGGLQNYFLLRTASHLISAGGSTLHSVLAKSNVKSMAVSRKKKGGKIKIGGIGVSIGPFKRKEDEQAVIEYLKYLDFLAVRDEASFEFASQLSLPYQPVNAFDLAALLPKIYLVPGLPVLKKKKKIIGISVCPVESINNQSKLDREERRNRMLCELLGFLNKQDDLCFKFLIINGNNITGDVKLTNEIIRLSGVADFEIVPYQQETRKMWDEIKGCDFVLSTRLHAAIFACFAGVPFMLNEYHKKCSDFLDTVGYCESYRLYDSDYDVAETANKILDILNGGIYVEPKFLSLAMEKAVLNFSEVAI